MAFSDAFDMALAIKRYLQIGCNQVIPIFMMMDILSLFDILICMSNTSEERMKINLKPVQESYHKMEMKDVAFILSEENIAD